MRNVVIPILCRNYECECVCMHVGLNKSSLDCTCGSVRTTTVNVYACIIRNYDCECMHVGLNKLSLDCTCGSVRSRKLSTNFRSQHIFVTKSGFVKENPPKTCFSNQVFSKTFQITYLRFRPRVKYCFLVSILEHQNFRTPGSPPSSPMKIMKFSKIL